MTINWFGLIVAVVGILVAIAIFVLAWNFVREARKGNRSFQWVQGFRRGRRWGDSSTPSHSRNSQ